MQYKMTQSSQTGATPLNLSKRTENLMCAIETFQADFNYTEFLENQIFAAIRLEEDLPNNYWDFFSPMQTLMFQINKNKQ